jgi:hypothetical protein
VIETDVDAPNALPVRLDGSSSRRKDLALAGAGDNDFGWPGTLRALSCPL